MSVLCVNFPLKEEENEAASRIQARFRGYQVRKDMAQKKASHYDISMPHSALVSSVVCRSTPESVHVCFAF